MGDSRSDHCGCYTIFRKETERQYLCPVLMGLL
jgi:hypothetical protein